MWSHKTLPRGLGDQNWHVSCPPFSLTSHTHTHTHTHTGTSTRHVHTHTHTLTSSPGSTQPCWKAGWIMWTRLQMHQTTQYYYCHMTQEAGHMFYHELFQSRDYIPTLMQCKQLYPFCLFPSFYPFFHPISSFLREQSDISYICVWTQKHTNMLTNSVPFHLLSYRVPTQPEHTWHYCGQ